ncbi:MAG: hypothetical protein R3B57_00680 [Phycisphaerales bacterium]
MQVELLDLWLPIVISTVVVFIASSIIWMALPYHKADMKAFKDEGPMTRALEETKPEAGMYYLPGCGNDKEKMKSEAFKEHLKKGPWAFIVVPKAMPSFPKCLGTIFVEFFLVTVFVAYLASHALPAGAAYLDVFRIVGTGCVLGYVFGSLGHNTFQLKPMRYLFFSAVDGVVFSLLTAGIFGWLWPAAEAAVSGGVPGIAAP